MTAVGSCTGCPCAEISAALCGTPAALAGARDGTAAPSTPPVAVARTCGARPTADEDAPIDALLSPPQPASAPVAPQSITSNTVATPIRPPRIACSFRRQR